MALFEPGYIFFGTPQRSRPTPYIPYNPIPCRLKIKARLHRVLAETSSRYRELYFAHDIFSDQRKASFKNIVRRP